MIFLCEYADEKLNFLVKAKNAGELHNILFDIITKKYCGINTWPLSTKEVMPLKHDKLFVFRTRSSH